MLKIDASDFKKLADDFGNMAKQVQYATAVALTRTAKDIQQEVIKKLPEKFTLRTSWYKVGPYSFRITPATKMKMYAEIYTKAPWMSLQETGGIKVAHQGKKYLAIPTTNVRPSKSKLIPSNLKPAFLLHGQGARPGSGRRVRWGGMSNAQSAFIGTINGHFGIWQRQGTGLRLMYNLKEEAKIQPRLQFIETAEKVVAERFAANFIRAFDEAMGSAR